MRVYPSNPMYPWYPPRAHLSDTPVSEELDHIRTERQNDYKRADARHEMATNGFVYIMYDGRDPSVLKVGKSRDPFQRLETGRTFYCPRSRLKLYKAYFTDDYGELERRVHVALKEWRVEGEWFELTPALAETVICAEERRLTDEQDPPY